MKQFYSGMLITLALVLAIVMGVVAMAESAEPEAALPPAVEEAPAASAGDDASDSAALQDALNAYNEARRSAQTEDLEAELNGYVASGKLTQAQADLILKHYNDQQSLRSGVCPNCGYQFSDGTGFGKGGRMNGGKGGRGGMRGFGSRSVNGQNSQNSQSGQANGAAFQFEGEAALNADGLEGI